MIATVILAQGAAEGYVNWVFLQAGVAPSGTWIGRWGALRHAAAKLGRDGEIGLPKAHRSFFNELDAWRNFLLHGDAKARESLRKALSAQQLSVQAAEVELLDCAYALNVMDRVDAACRWAEERTGIPAPAARGAWVAADEC
ncbi:hypothetical protein OHR86_12415 [Streptomyces sp. NBC_00441]|uniref:hypothetical protein n=1 Tax=Streptomyces sp. NBC_00441 TaxID=2975742 RepID=UPI002E298613|nr:hypothetical protein [Streptomyces sp. NBC_00441]